MLMFVNIWGISLDICFGGLWAGDMAAQVLKHDEECFVEYGDSFADHVVVFVELTVFCDTELLGRLHETAAFGRNAEQVIDFYAFGDITGNHGLADDGVAEWCLMAVALKALGNVVMYDVAHIGLVDTHAECYGGHKKTNETNK